MNVQFAATFGTQPNPLQGDALHVAMENRERILRVGHPLKAVNKRWKETKTVDLVKAIT